MIWLSRLVHLIFGGVFVWVGAMKAWNPAAFLNDVRSLGMLPDPYAGWLAMVFPWLAILAGLAVIFDIWRSRILHLVFGGVFLYAGLVKARSPMVFLDDIRSFDMLPDPYAALVAMFLPWLEIFAGLAVISGVFRRGGLLLLNASLLVFLAAILISWYRGIDIRCGCFGGSGDATSNYIELIVRDFFLLALGFWLAFYKPRTENREP